MAQTTPYMRMGAYIAVPMIKRSIADGGAANGMLDYTCEGLEGGMSEIVSRVSNTNGTVVSLQHCLKLHLFRVLYLVKKRPRRFMQELEARMKLSQHLSSVFPKDEEDTFLQMVASFPPLTSKTPPLPLSPFSCRTGQGTLQSFPPAQRTGGSSRGIRKRIRWIRL